jgi:hypothetical protein
MCLVESSWAAATSFATAARTNSTGEGESGEELEGETASWELAFVPASSAPSNTAVATRNTFACLVLSGTLLV